MDISGVVESIIQRAEANSPPENGDYVDAEGFRMCGKCHTRREFLLEMKDFKTGNPVKRKVPVQCKCRKEASQAEEAKRKYNDDMAAIRNLRQASLMDERLASATFATYTVRQENQKVFTAATRYVEKFDELYANGQGLLLYGPVGTGKSYTAAVIANELMNRKHSAIMTSFIKLLQNVSSFSGDEERIARLNRAKLLIIDDLGAERSTDTALEKVYNIIDSRYRSGKPLILTTNLSMSQIKGETDIRYVRIYDRILEMCYPLKLEGLSWRKQEAAARFRNMRELLEV